VPLLGNDTTEREVEVKFIASAGDEIYEALKKIFVTPT